ncbi:MAG: FAD-binding oxidoreductase [candidate division Zixibacteria bacterium]|nr:FAD-binding oxidoreductase [candidate division Zixibacteria bacterium]MDH3937420.1 FAD-binding oxidoreductase [candidate division Zixibacteria bacterium]MDH4034428.1 FAD-binding oxidoreductase [candidate division Zixibacteria bacterium]
MRMRADAIIIGGGIIGVATAFYLAREKFGQILLLEKEPLLGAGATSKAAGGIRAQFSTRVNVEMSMLSEKVFTGFKEETGFDALYDKVGYMFLLQSDEEVIRFRASYEMQKSLGLDVAMLEPSEIAMRAPHVSLEGIQAAAFCDDDGLGDPHEFLTGYEKAARKLGVEFAFDTEVTGIDVKQGEVAGVRTNHGTISCPLVINCAGPHAGVVAEMVGADLPVVPVRRQIVTTGELDFVKPSFPMVVDVKTGLYCHKESQGMLLGWADKSVEPSFDVSLDPDYTDHILEIALERIPQLEQAEVGNEWTGLYEVTPDHHAIIGWEPSVNGMFHIAGFSGHGFMHAPAAGLLSAEIMSGKKPTLDISAVSPTRFGQGVMVEETNVI